MNLHKLNGWTPWQHNKLNMQSSIGISAEDDSIQYIGRQIELHDGVTMVSEQTCNNADRKQPFKRLVSPQPDLEKQLPGLKSEVIQKAASNLVAEFEIGAIEKSPTKEVLCAVFLECMRSDVPGTVKTVLKLSKTNSLSADEKLQIMLTAEEEPELSLSAVCWTLARIPLSIRFAEAKKQFQRIPGPFLTELDNVNAQLTALTTGKPVKDTLLEIRQILESENNTLSRELVREVDNIEKQFLPGAKESNYLSDNDCSDFKIYTERLLYLYAACSGFSQEADITELTSYIRSVLYTTDSENVWHIAEELAYLSKQPDSINYCRYIDAVANILKAPVPVVSQFEGLKQLSDINGFALLESKPLATYLMALRANIDSIVPDYSQLLHTAVDNLELEFADTALPEGKSDIKTKVHRLLMVIAACKSSRQIMDSSVLADFVSAIMGHGNKKNIPYLICGLARLVQSTAKIQQIFDMPGTRSKEHMRLAPLQFLAFLPDKISEDNIVELCQSLRNSTTTKRQMKDGKVFHQWLVTLEEALASKVMNDALVMPLLKKLSQSLTFEKLGLLHTVFKIKDNSNEFLNSMSFSCLKDGLPLLIAEKGAAALEVENKEGSQWLLKQRHYHLLPVYLLSVTEYGKKRGNTEITDLIHEFIETSANNTFIQSRQSPLNNPHLQAVYREYPQFQAGWGANFSHFSEETRRKLLSPGEALELTEDPWDLFISGVEVNSCQSPDGNPHENSGLMSYVMDGRNAMIVRKNKKGTILTRSVIRVVLDQDDHPALFLERAYPDKSDSLFIDAARDIADQMELPLYLRLDTKKDGKGATVKLLKGRAPYDYFDSFMALKTRQEITFNNVQRDVKHP